MQIAKYFASLSVDISQASFKKADKALDQLENRLKKLGKFGNKGMSLDIGSFNVDQKKLNTVIGNALDMASRQVTFEISRFAVNRAALNRALSSVGGLGDSGTINPNGQPRTRNPSPEQLRRRSARNAEWDRQERLRNALADRRFGLQGQRLDLQAARLNGGTRSSHAAVAGGAAGGGLIGRGVSGFMGPALALGLGGYGLSNLNQRNQQVVSAQLQTSAVVQQAGGTEQQGKDSFQYLKNEGQRIGFNYLDASQDYNKLISGLTGSGVGLKESQKVFTGFAELARVNKLDKTTQNRLFRALSQVAGKGKLQSEELTGQIAEALPGGTALFAEAYQKQIGGNKTGAEAIQQLLADMKKGKVTSDILTYAGAAASQRANAGGALGAASTASQAEQARYQNSVNDLAALASGSGIEEGFARIFRTLNAGLSESGGLVRTLSEQFNEATKFADDLLLFPQSFIRALEGKDSLVGDFLGIDKTEQLRKDWSDIKQIFTDISSIKFDFLPTLEATAKEIAAIFNAVAEFQKFKSGNLPTSETNNSSTEKANLFGLEYASPAAIFGDILNNTGFNLNKARERGRAVYEDPSSPYYQDAAGYDDQQAEMAKAAAEDKAMGIVNNNNQIDIVVNVDGSTLQGLDANAQAQAIGEAVANMFVQSFDQVNVQFPVKQ